MHQRRLEEEVAARTSDLERTAECLREEIRQRERAEAATRVQHDLNEKLLDSLPYPALLVRRDRTILAVNAAARRAGAHVGGVCWRDFAKGRFIPDVDKRRLRDRGSDDTISTRCIFCRADESLSTFIPTNCSRVRAFGRTWDAWWIPLDGETLLHFAIDVTERLVVQQSLENEIVQRRAMEGELRAHN